MEIKRDTLQLSTANFCLLNQHDYAVMLAPSIHFSKFAASSNFLSFFWHSEDLFSSFISRFAAALECGTIILRFIFIKLHTSLT